MNAPTPERTAKPLRFRGLFTAPFGFLAGWVLLVISAAAMEKFTGRPVPTWLFKRMTDYPCVGCSSTRRVMAACAAISVARFSITR